jgi:hypothetical protein
LGNLGLSPQIAILVNRRVEPRGAGSALRLAAMLDRGRLTLLSGNSFLSIVGQSAEGQCIVMNAP